MLVLLTGTRYMDASGACSEAPSVGASLGLSFESVGYVAQPNLIQSGSGFRL